MRGALVGAIALGGIVLGVGAFEDGLLSLTDMLLLVVAPAGIEAWVRWKIALLERDTQREIAVLKYTAEADESEDS